MIQGFEDLPLDLMHRVDPVRDHVEAALRSGLSSRIDDDLGLVRESAGLERLVERLAIGRLTGDESFACCNLNYSMRSIGRIGRRSDGGCSTRSFRSVGGDPAIDPIRPCDPIW